MSPYRPCRGQTLTNSCTASLELPALSQGPTLKDKSLAQKHRAAVFPCKRDGIVGQGPDLVYRSRKESCLTGSDKGPHDRVSVAALLGAFACLIGSLSRLVRVTPVPERPRPVRERGNPDL